METHFFPRHMLTHNLGLTSKTFDTRQLSQPPCSPIQDIGRARFGQEEYEQHERKATEPHELPDRPRPAFSLSGEPAHQRSEHRPTNSRNAPDTDPIRSLVRCKHIPYACSPGRQYRTADEAGQETKA